MKYRFFYLLLVNEIITNLTLYCPYVLISLVDRGALIAILAAFLIALIKVYFFIYVFNRYKTLTLIEISQILFGKFMGKFLTYIYLILCLAVGFFMYKGLVEIVKNFMLITSPLLLISAILVIVPAVTFSNTSTTFLQAMAFTAVLMVIGLVALITLSSGYINHDYLIGSFLHTINIPTFKGVTIGGAFFSGTYHLSLFNPEFKKLSYPKTILVMGFTGIVTALLAVYIPLSIWGPGAAQQLMFPWVSTTDTMSVDLFIIERALFLMLPLFFLLTLSNALIYSFVSYGLFCKLHPAPKVSIFVKVVICALFIGGSMLIPNTKKTFEYATYGLTIWYSFKTLLAVLLFTMTKLKEKSAA